MSPTNSAVLEEPMTENENKSADCLCGILGCKGHQVVNGKIAFKGHPDIADGDVELIRTPRTSAGA